MCFMLYPLTRKLNNQSSKFPVKMNLILQWLQAEADTMELRAWLAKIATDLQLDNQAIFMTPLQIKELESEEIHP